MPTDNEPMTGTVYINGLKIGEFEISAVDINKLDRRSARHNKLEAA